MGTPYKRGKKGIWWIQYYAGGKQHKESSKSTKKSVALRLLKLREGDVGHGIMPDLAKEKLTYADLKCLILEDYKQNGKKSIDRLGRSIKQLDRFFSDRARAMNISKNKIMEYRKQRLDQGAANATINREVAALKRMLSLSGIRTDKVEMLKEASPKKGFLEPEQFNALLQALPEYLVPMVAFAYRTGWREAVIRGLTWSNYDPRQGVITVEGELTKTGEPLTYFPDEDMKELLRLQRRKKSPWIFPGVNKGKIQDFRGGWNAACRAVGLGYGYRVNKKYVEKWQGKLPGGPTIHDMRRSVARNCERMGMSQTAAMELLGMKTDSIFKRYRIFSDEERRETGKKMGEFLKRQAGVAMGQVVDIKVPT